jgi:hypothetical protein
VAPALQNYHYALFVVGYPIGLYPVTFFAGPDLGTELGASEKQTKDLELSSRWRIEASNESEFVALLARIFDSQKTRQVIATILGQSMADASAAER